MHPVNIAEGTFPGLHAEEIMLFRKLLNGVAGEGVEIGCLDGFSTSHILQCSRLHLTSIDPFIGDSMDQNLVGNRDRVKANVAPWKERHTLIEGYSWDVAPKWNTPLDFLFIDGDHNYESVMRDISAWAPFVKIGGIMALHDARQGKPGGPQHYKGPTRAVNEAIRGQAHLWEMIGEAYSLCVARKILEGEPDKRAGTAC